MTAILTHYVVEYRRMTHQLKKQSMENDTFLIPRIVSPFLGTRQICMSKNLSLLV
jgi:hypothetical protein